MQREVETFLLLLVSALCLSTDSPKLHLEFTLTPLSHYSELLDRMPANRGERQHEKQGERNEIMKLIQFLISVSLAQLSSIRLCNSPNLEPPDCNQIHSAQRCEIQVV